MRPNVLVLISDDTDPAYLGPYGGPYPTPNLDWLAREGARLSRHEVVAPLCTPSRYAYLTGRYPSRSPAPALDPALLASLYLPDGPRLIGFEAALQPGQPHAATIFRENGYTTAYVGKFHCGRPAHTLGMLDIDEGLSEEEADRRRRHNQRLAVEELGRIGWDYAANLAWGNIDWEPWHRLDIHNLEWTTDGALRFLESRRNQQQPFFMVVGTNVIHGPRHASNIEDQDPLITPAGRLAQAPSGAHPPRRTIRERLSRAGLTPTHRAVGTVWLDDCLGALRQKLAEIGELDRTLIVYQSDHSVFGKSSCHASGSRTGFLARWPGRIPAGTVCSHTVQNIDFLPTLIELLELRAPAGYRMDGRSYAAALKGERFWAGDTWFNQIGTARSVQTPEFKYIAFRYQRAQIERMQADPDRGIVNQLGRSDPWMPEFYHRHYWDADQLYRIDHDEGEQINLAGFPRYAAVLAEMRGKLARHLEAIGDSFCLTPDPFQTSEEFRLRVARRMATAIEEVGYFHTGGW